MRVRAAVILSLTLAAGVFFSPAIQRAVSCGFCAIRLELTSRESSTREKHIFLKGNHLSRGTRGSAFLASTSAGLTQSWKRRASVTLSQCSIKASSSLGWL